VSHRGFQKCSFHDPNFLQVAEKIFQTYGREKLTVFVGLARRIWFRRKEVVHAGEFKHPNKLLRKAVKSWEVYKSVISSNPTSSVAKWRRTKPSWTTPLAGWLKAN
jgi:hypothetical protein